MLTYACTFLASSAAARVEPVAKRGAGDSDLPFYSNNVTGETSWSRPASMPYFDDDGRPYWLVHDMPSWEAADPRDGWRPRWSPDGEPFFERLDTQEVSWERPRSMGWSVRSSTRKFYHNVVTSETTRDKPAVLGHRDEEQNATYYVGSDGNAVWDKPESAAWHEAKSPADGRVFYFNEATGESTWTPPEGSNVAWHVHHDEISEL